MSDPVENTEDRFSHDMAQIDVNHSHYIDKKSSCQLLVRECALNICKQLERHTGYPGILWLWLHEMNKYVKGCKTRMIYSL